MHALDDTLKTCGEKYPPSLKTLVAGTRECRMIRDSILDTELAEPAIGEVYLHFHDQSNRSERIAKTYPTTSIRIIKFRINRTGDPSTNGQYEVQVRCEARDRSTAVSDLPHHVIFGNCIAK